MKEYAAWNVIKSPSNYYRISCFPGFSTISNVKRNIIIESTGFLISFGVTNQVNINTKCRCVIGAINPFLQH